MENVDDYITDLFKPIFVNASLQRLTTAVTLAGAIKGGGGMDSHQVTITYLILQFRYCNFFICPYKNML